MPLPAYVQIFYLETIIVIGWCQVSLSLNTSTCLSLFIKLDTPRRSGELVVALRVCSTCPDLGTHYPYCVAAFYYFGKGLSYFSEKPVVSHVLLHACF
jgi:hypothetical protein